MQLFHQPAQQRAGIDPERMRLVELGQRRRGIAGQHVLEQAADAAAVGQAEHVADLLGA